MALTKPGPSPFVPAEWDSERVTVTEFMLGYVMGYKSEAGMFATEVAGPHELPADWPEVFPVHLPERRLYEGLGVLAFLSPPAGWRRQWQIRVSVRDGLARSAIPDCLWLLAVRGNPVGGVFITDEHTRYWDERSGRTPPREDSESPRDAADDIPF
jgi:hypothetical protein